MWTHGAPAPAPDSVNGVRMPDAATARPGTAADNADQMASMAANTTMNRPPQAAGGRGLTSVPGGSRKSTGAKHPSFIGSAGSRKQRRAKSAPETTWEHPALMAP